MRNLFAISVILCSFFLLTSCGQDEVVAPTNADVFITNADSNYFTLTVKFDADYNDYVVVVDITNFTTTMISSTYGINFIIGHYYVIHDGINYWIFDYPEILEQCDGDNPSLTLALHSGDIVGADSDRDGFPEKEQVAIDSRLPK